MEVICNSLLEVMDNKTFFGLLGKKTAYNEDYTIYLEMLI
jgi:hypothetical protein